MIVKTSLENVHVIVISKSVAKILLKLNCPSSKVQFLSEYVWNLDINNICSSCLMYKFICLGEI